MLDLLLVCPYYVDDTFYHMILDWHLGAGYIAAYLRERGVAVDCFIHQTPVSLHDIAPQILKLNPKVVGFTCYDVNYYFVKLMAQALKKKKKDLTIIVGGPTATFSDKLILDNEPSLDICVRGEGEQTAFELIQSLRMEKNLKSIKGITYRKNGSIRRTADRPLLTQSNKNCGLDIAPSPYLSGIFPTDLNRGILTSRGCVYHCTYCNFAAMSRWTVRFHSIERVIRELRYIAEYSPQTTVAIYDDNFSMNKRRAKEICRKIIEARLPLQFTCLSRTENLDTELLKLMQQAHIKQISIGLESSIPKNLRTIKKVVDGRGYGEDLSPEKKFVRKIKILSNKIRRLGLDFVLSIIIGLPDQNQSEAEKTIDFVDALRPSQCVQDFLTLYPGTPLFQTRKKYGLDVISPKTVLPFKTKFLFDVQKIRLSAFAAPNYGIKETLISMSVKMLSRTSGYPQGGKSSIPSAFFDEGPFRLFKFVAENKLNDHLVLSPAFLSICDSEKSARKELYSLIDNGTPIINLVILKKAKNNNIKPADNFLHVYELVFLTEVIERRRLPSQKIALFVFMPLSQLNNASLAKIRNLNGAGHDRKIVMLSLNSREDKAAFTDLVSNSTPLKNIMKNSNEEFYITEACQWQNNLCPAITDNSLYVNKNGGVSFCKKGGCLRVQAKKRDLHETLSKRRKQALLKQLQERRGCRSCAVEKTCSKCLYTHPYTEKEFCELRKKTDTDKLVRLLKAHEILGGLARYEIFQNLKRKKF